MGNEQEESKTFYTFRFSAAKAAVHRVADRFVGLQYKIDFKNTDEEAMNNANDMQKLLCLFNLKALPDASCIYAEKIKFHEKGKTPCLEMIIPLTLEEMSAGLDLLDAEQTTILQTISKYTMARFQFTTKPMQKTDIGFLMKDIGISESEGRRGLQDSENYKIVEGGTWKRTFYATGEKISSIPEILKKELKFYAKRDQFSELQLECTGKKRIIYSREKELNFGYSECQGKDIYTRQEFEERQN